MWPANLRAGLPMQIDLDFDVYKHLTLRRKSEQETYSDVIRVLLDLEPLAEAQSGVRARENRRAWTSKGVVFPHGTEFRAHYKGRRYDARVGDGVLICNGVQYDSPSAAAVDIKGHPANGWLFWECRRPGDSEWTLIKSLRRSGTA
jgi:hypothetical protein